MKKKFLIADKAKFDAQGRGQGRNDKYVPGLRVREVSSIGQRQRVYIQRFNRCFEMMSHGETLTLLQLDWNDEVVEVREQFPLDPELTLKIADSLKLFHPGFRWGGSIMTTDFLVTYQKANGRLVERAYQIKRNRTDLENRRTRAKLQIEGEYWKSKGIKWCVVLSDEYNTVFCDNLRLLQPFRNDAYSCADLNFMLIWLSRSIGNNPNLRFTELSGDLPPLPDSGHCLSVHEALKIVLGKKLLPCPIRDVPLQECCLSQFTTGGARC